MSGNSSFNFKFDSWNGPGKLSPSGNTRVPDLKNIAKIESVDKKDDLSMEINEELKVLNPFLDSLVEKISDAFKASKFNGDKDKSEELNSSIDKIEAAYDYWVRKYEDEKEATQEVFDGFKKCHTDAKNLLTYVSSWDNAPRNLGAAVAVSNERGKNTLKRCLDYINLTIDARKEKKTEGLLVRPLELSDLEIKGLSDQEREELKNYLAEKNAELDEVKQEDWILDFNDFCKNMKSVSSKELEKLKKYVLDSLDYDLKDRMLKIIDYNKNHDVDSFSKDQKKQFDRYIDLVNDAKKNKDSFYYVLCEGKTYVIKKEDDKKKKDDKEKIEKLKEQTALIDASRVPDMAKKEFEALSPSPREVYAFNIRAHAHHFLKKLSIPSPAGATPKSHDEARANFDKFASLVDEILKTPKGMRYVVYGNKTYLIKDDKKPGTAKDPDAAKKLDAKDPKKSKDDAKGAAAEDSGEGKKKDKKDKSDDKKEEPKEKPKEKTPEEIFNGFPEKARIFLLERLQIVHDDYMKIAEDHGISDETERRKLVDLQLKEDIMLLTDRYFGQKSREDREKISQHILSVLK
ncbi:MAG TPA: hypothetical protein VF817_03680 [Patescibacteria group bacterium]